MVLIIHLSLFLLNLRDILGEGFTLTNIKLIIRKGTEQKEGQTHSFSSIYIDCI